MRKKTLLKKPFICNFTLQKQYCNKNDRTLVFSVSFSFVKAVGVGVNLVKKKYFRNLNLFIWTNTSQPLLFSQPQAVLKELSHG